MSSIIYRDLELDSIRPLKVHHNYIKVDLHTYSLHKIKFNHKLVFFFFFLSVPFPVCYLCAEITRTLVQKLKTRVVKKNCNPVWNEELTLSISDLNVPINLTVFDKDTFTVDDKMGEAGIDLQPYIASLKMGLQNLPKGCVVSRVQPSQNNCLADESCIVWDDGKLHQDMILRLRNVESGEVTIQIEWIDVPGCRGLKTEGTG